MVAERLLDLRLRILPSPRMSVPASAMSGVGFMGAPSFEHNMAAQIAMEQAVEDVVTMVAAAHTAKVIFNMGGRVVNYVFDKTKRLWTMESPLSFDEMVETYNLSSTASLMASPIGSPVVVANEVAKLEGQIEELTEKNTTQQRMIALYNKERQELAKIATDTPQQHFAEKETDRQLEEAKFYTTSDPWPNGNGKGSITTTTTTKEDLPDSKITKVITVFAEHVLGTEVNGNMVHIRDTNVVDGTLVHNWGKLLREQFGRITEAKIPQDVRNATDNGVYNILIN